MTLYTRSKAHSHYLKKKKNSKRNKLLLNNKSKTSDVNFTNKLYLTQYIQIL